jgi:thiol:disulfide interchange protein DsbD
MMFAASLDRVRALVRGLRGVARCAVLLVCAVAWLPGFAADDFLEPEKAFVLTVRMTAPQQAQLQFDVAPGYYLYRDRFAVVAQGATLGDAQVPAGKVKYDENFQKNVETLRGQLRIAVPVAAAAGPFTLQVTSQGCADAGLCYPPMTSEWKLDPGALTAVSAVSPDAGVALSVPGSQATRSPVAALRDGSLVDEVLASGQFWRIVGAFLVAGLLLSLTPCVLPMLPILSSIIVGTQERPSRLRGLALASSYSLGMAMVYTLLGVAAGLAGEGFSAALQTPWALGSFAALLVLFSLSMFDVYELRLPARFTTHVSAHCDRLPAGQVAGVFVMGGLSALIVSPCVTAPLATALVFISQSRDVVLGGTALFAMATGMSAPLLLLGVSSGRWLPRSGPWMHTIKRLFGAMMLGVAIWIAQPVLPAALVMASWGLLMLLVGFVLRPLHPGHHRHALRSWVRRAGGVAALVLGSAQLVGAASGGRDPLQPLAHWFEPAAEAGQGPKFRPVRSIAELDGILRMAGRPVVLDFYADWCVSCKEMERFTFSDPEVARRLEGALLLKADVTGNTADDRALLARFKLFGPPGTLFFDARGREQRQARVVGFQTASRFRSTLDQAGL